MLTNFRVCTPQWGFHWLFPGLEMDMQLHRLMAKMGYVGEGYKLFYEIMAIFLLFFTLSLQKNSAYFHTDSSILIMNDLSLLLFDSLPLNLCLLHNCKLIDNKIFFHHHHQVENTRDATGQAPVTVGFSPISVVVPGF